ncbi:hypothetical protein RQP46_009944 [Phenoliferia psychrophenolica]
MDRLPFELLEQIIQLATFQLVSDERNLSTPALPHLASATPFLLAASLVSRTWRPIAQSALLKAGVITPQSVYPFVDLLEERGVLKSVREVRVRRGERGAGRGVDQWELIPMIRLLIAKMGALEQIEFVGCVPSWSLWPSGASGIKHLILSNQDTTAFGTSLRDPHSLTPSHITFSEAPRTDSYTGGEFANLASHLPLVGLHKTFPSLRHLSITATFDTIEAYLRNLTSRTSPIDIEELEVDCRDWEFDSGQFEWPLVALGNLRRLVAPLEALTSVLRSARTPLPSGIRVLEVVPIFRYGSSRKGDLIGEDEDGGSDAEDRTDAFVDALADLKELESVIVRAGVHLALDIVKATCVSRGITCRLK